MGADNVVPPTYLRGFDRKRGLVAQVFVLMTIGFFVGLIPGRHLKPAPSYCPEDEPNCARPELFAFEFVCGSVFLWQSFVSIRSWHIRRSPQKHFPQNPIGRVFGYSAESEMMAAVSLSFQFWDLVATPWIPEFSSAIMLGHHFCAALVSFIALQYQFYHYYVVFFFALTEVSSFPLVLLSLSKYYPPIPGSFRATIADVAVPLFAITFSYYRVFLWCAVTKDLWSDAVHVLSNGTAEQYRPGKSFALYIILFISLALTFLQFFWFLLIVAEVLTQLGFDVPDFNPGFE